MSNEKCTIFLLHSNNVLCIIINTLCSFVSLTMPEDGVPEFLDNIKKKLKEYYDLKIKDNK